MVYKGIKLLNKKISNFTVTQPRFDFGEKYKLKKIL